MQIKVRAPKLALAALACLLAPDLASAAGCGEIVDAIIEKSGAARIAAADGTPWIALSHPRLTRITITCYGNETAPVAEVMLDEAAEDADEETEAEAYRAVGAIGAAVIANIASETLTAEARRCGAHAGAPGKVGRLEVISKNLSCLATPADHASPSSVTLTIYMTEGKSSGTSKRAATGTGNTAASSASPAKPLPSLKRKKPKATSKSFCPLFDHKE